MNEHVVKFYLRALWERWENLTHSQRRHIARLVDAEVRIGTYERIEQQAAQIRVRLAELDRV